MRRRCHAPILLAALLACRTSATPGPPAAAPEPEVVAPDPEVAAAPAPTDDRDADGIPDGPDRCPDEPEDLDRFEDEDGCVDRDNDGDKILDAHEFKNGRWTNCDYRHENGVDIDCRDLPEDFDGDGDHDGCPDHLLNNDCQVKISERIPLDSRGRLIGDAPEILDGLAAEFNAVLSVGIWVEGHIDRQRDSKAAKQISQHAAEAVIEALVLRGVARERLEPIGWGHEKPAGPRATTPAARARDRRVEFAFRSCPVDLASTGPGDTPTTHECH